MKYMWSKRKVDKYIFPIMLRKIIYNVGDIIETL